MADQFAERLEQELLCPVAHELCVLKREDGKQVPSCYIIVRYDDEDYCLSRRALYSYGQLVAVNNGGDLELHTDADDYEWSATTMRQLCEFCRSEFPYAEFNGISDVRKFASERHPNTHGRRIVNGEMVRA